MAKYQPKLIPSAVLQGFLGVDPNKAAKLAGYLHASDKLTSQAEKQAEQKP